QAAPDPIQGEHPSCETFPGFESRPGSSARRGTHTASLQETGQLTHTASLQETGQLARSNF
ncbi:MAG: hypothetical protein ACO3PR_10970, partial [Limisphaerales bacterium]